MLDQISQQETTVTASPRKKFIEVNNLVKYFPVRTGLM